MFDWIKELLVTWYEWFKPFVVVDKYQQGVVLTWGVDRAIWFNFYRDPVLDPGFHLVWPFGFEEVLTDEVVTRVINLSSQSLTTKDGVPIVVSGAVTFSITNIRKALLTVRTVHQAVADSCLGVIASTVREYNWDQLTSDEFSDKLATSCRKYARKYGLEIERMQLTDLARMRALRLHVDQTNDYKGRQDDD